MAHSWETPRIKFRCLKTLDRHVVPHEGCLCGIHGFNALEDADAYKFKGNVLGAVLGWGRIIRHKQEGWRAEYAEVIALLAPREGPSQWYQAAPVYRVANRYGLPVVQRKWLTAYAEEAGEYIEGYVKPMRESGSG